MRDFHLTYDKNKNESHTICVCACNEYTVKWPMTEQKERKLKQTYRETHDIRLQYPIPIPI